MTSLLHLLQRQRDGGVEREGAAFGIGGGEGVLAEDRPDIGEATLVLGVQGLVRACRRRQRRVRRPK